MSKDKRLRNSIIRLCVGVILIIATIIIIVAAKGNPQWVRESYSPFSRAVCDGLSRFFGIFPFSFVEICAYALIIGGLAAILLLIFRWVKAGGWRSVFKWFSYLFIIASAAVAIFFTIWGLNYFSTPLASYLDLEVKPRTDEELYETTEYYLQLVNEYSYKVNRDEDGVAELGEFNILASECGDGYAALTEQYPIFKGSYSAPKSILSWRLMSKTQITGIFIPYTAECNVDPDCAPASLPYTMMHEMAHRLSIAPENEANFVAFLACRASSVPEFQYSGYYSAFIYCYNAVAKINKDKQQELWDGLSEGAANDLIAAIKHYQKNEGAISKAAETINDTYLKTMNQASGVQSYGEVADLLIADYFTNLR